MRYLSPQWMDAARHALAGDERLHAALADVTLTVEQVVEDGPGDVTRWHVAIRDGRVALAAGPAPRADVTFATNRATASEIASGALPAQRAFVEGRLRVGGDLSLLIAHQRAFAAVTDALAPIRADTTYE